MRLGSVLGVRLVIHPSWLALLLVLGAMLASSLAPPDPGVLAIGAALLVGALVAVLLLGALVAHELAHALVARQRGLAVEEVSLSTFGLTTVTRHEPQSPATEALVAAAGPVLSLALGLGLLALGLAIPDDGSEPLWTVDQVAWWLALADLVLGGASLLPAFPLDGGRIVRALAWRVTGDLLRATRIASLIGRGVGLLGVAAGLALAVAGEIVLGTWLLILGWFLARLARGAYAQVWMARLVAGLTVADAMEEDVAIVPPTLALETLRAQHGRLGAPPVYAVVSDGRLLGALFPSQLRPTMRRGRTDARRARDAMVPVERLPRIAPDQPLLEVVDRFETSRYAGLPVSDETDRGRLVGSVSREGIIRLLRRRGDPTGPKPSSQASPG